MEWNETEIGEIKLELENKRTGLAEKLSRRIGVDTESVRDKIHEIRAKEKVKRMASGIKGTLKKHRGRRIRKYGTKVKKWIRD